MRVSPADGARTPRFALGVVESVNESREISAQQRDRVRQHAVGGRNLGLDLMKDFQKPRDRQASNAEVKSLTGMPAVFI